MSSSGDEVMEEGTNEAVVMENDADDEEQEAEDTVAVVDDEADDEDDEGDADTADTADSAHGDEDMPQEGVTVEEDEDDQDETAEPVVEGKEEEEEPTPKKKAATPKKGSPRKRTPIGGSKKGRAPAVKGLTIPFRAVKRTMKLDKDIATVQNEAAIVTTLAAELFLKSLAKESQRNAKSRGRNTIRYEDVAEARTKNPALDFLETLLP